MLKTILLSLSALALGNEEGLLRLLALGGNRRLTQGTISCKFDNDCLPGEFCADKRREGGIEFGFCGPLTKQGDRCRRDQQCSGSQFCTIDIPNTRAKPGEIRPVDDGFCVEANGGRPGDKCNINEHCATQKRVVGMSFESQLPGVCRSGTCAKFDNAPCKSNAECRSNKCTAFRKQSFLQNLRGERGTLREGFCINEERNAFRGKCNSNADCLNSCRIPGLNPIQAQGLTAVQVGRFLGEQRSSKGFGTCSSLALGR